MTIGGDNECACGRGDEPCPGPDGVPLCARPLDILKPLPVEELIKDLNQRLHDMAMAANEDCTREEERSRQWCNDRWRRMNDETRYMRAQRDAMLKAWSAMQPQEPVLVYPDNPLS